MPYASITRRCRCSRNSLRTPRTRQIQPGPNERRSKPPSRPTPAHQNERDHYLSDGVYFLLERIRSSPSNTFSQNPQNFLHRDPDVGTGAIFCGLGHSLSATCQVSLFGSFPVSVLRRVSDVLDAPALRSPLPIRHAVGDEPVGTFASAASDSARKHAGHAALCPSRAVVSIRTRRAGSASGSTASVSVLDRVVSQAVGYLRLCFLFAPPRIGERWFWPRMPRPGGLVFGLFTCGSVL